MNFKEALDKICNQFNKEIIFERRVISILDDFGAFKDVPYYKLFYKTALSSGDLKKLVVKNENDRERAIYTFVAQSGLDEKKVREFVSLIFKCYFGEINVPNKSKENTRKAKNTKLATQKSPDLIIDESSINLSNEAQFLGVPLGSKYHTFENALFSRGASLYSRNTTYVTYILNNFIFDKRANVTLHCLGNSKVIFKVTIIIETGLTVDNLRVGFNTRILNVYRNKYGNYQTMPVHDSLNFSKDTLYKWVLKDSEITIRDAFKKTIIEYRLCSDVVKNYEANQLAERTRKIQEAEQARKEQEEERRKQEEERKKKEAKRLFDTI